MKTIGKLGQALKFNGSTSEIIGPANFANNYFTNDFTIAAWVKSSDTSNNSKVIVSTYAGFGGPSIIVRFAHSGAHQQILFSGLSSGVNADTLPNGIWHHVVATRTTAGVETVYMDGVQLVQETNDTSGTFSYPDNSQLTIGQEAPGLGGDTMNGVMDDVRIYNRALSAAEVATLYKLGTVIIKR